MTPEEKAKQVQEDLDKADKGRADKARADAEEAANQGEKLDAVLAHLDLLGKRMDAYDDAATARRKDEEGKGEMEDEIERDKPRELAADSMVRKDGAADAEEIENYKRENGATHKIAADSVIAQIQSHADRASSAWGKDAKHPWDSESIVAYRRRTAREHQQHSAAWKNVDLRTLSGQALRNATAQIYADSIAASSSPESYPDTLIERHVRDPISGQKRIEFYGSPSAWTNQFKGGGMRVQKFKTGARYD